jgi:hypothetical protein
MHISVNTELSEITVCVCLCGGGLHQLRANNASRMEYFMDCRPDSILTVQLKTCKMTINYWHRLILLKLYGKIHVP